MVEAFSVPDSWELQFVNNKPTTLRALFTSVQLAIVAALAVVATPALAGDPPVVFQTGDLVISSSFYQGNNSTITVGQGLPSVTVDANSNPTTTPIAAVANGSYPNVFNNDSQVSIGSSGKLNSTTVDANFGVTSQIVLSDVSATTGAIKDSITLAAPTGFNASNGLVTSFSSKSELALNLSSDGTQLTFMGYTAPVNAVDVSNSNTPGVIDPSNNDMQTATYRAIGSINAFGQLTVTPTNAYSGNNGRAVVLLNGNYYMVGNGGNGNGIAPKSGEIASPNAIVSNTGVQMLPAGGGPNTTVVGAQQGTVGAKNGWQFGFAAATPDKSGKDDNFRGLTVFDNTIYTSKGSGSNGVNSIYQVGPGGVLPTAGSASSTAITTLPGFPATGTSSNPFGIWFANATTMYVSQEGDGTATFNSNGTVKSFDAGGGLQKWTFSGGTWNLDYTLTSGLNLGSTYAVTGGLNADGSINPTGTGASVLAATDGLRNLTGKVNSDGSVTLYAITSTISTSGDQGADPNKLVAITDTLADTTANQASAESFTTLDTAEYGEVLRGVSFAPTTPVPLPAAGWLLVSGLGALGAARRRRRA
jgi:hypothetical protein